MRFYEGRRFVLVAINLILCLTLAAQKKDSTWVGAIDGSVKDTVLNYFMQSATVSVYRASDTSLLAFTMTNSFGGFHVLRLPLNMPLSIRVSYIGYETWSRTIV